MLAETAFTAPIVNAYRLRSEYHSLSPSYGVGRTTFVPKRQVVLGGDARQHRLKEIARRAGKLTTSTTTRETTVMGLSKVVIAGGTGFVGQRLAQALLKRDVAVTILTRSASSSVPRGAKAVVWSPTDGKDNENKQNPAWYDALRGADGVVNVCGEPIVTRWTARARDALISSRVDATAAIVGAMNAIAREERPKALVNASAVGYYGTRMAYDATVDETAARGDDFLARLCDEWEATARNASTFHTRVVVLRFGIVLGAGGGALAKMIPAYQLFVGGPLGSGRQWVPWVHVDDVVGAAVHALTDDALDGVYNCTAPNPVTMGQLCSALAAALKRPNLFAVPGFVIKAALGDASCVLLEGQKAVPKRLKDAGYTFQYTDVNDAMRAIVREI